MSGPHLLAGALTAALAAALVLVFLSSSAMAEELEEAAVVTADRGWILCWYCGPGYECPLPWEEEKAAVINCTTRTCMKFDAWRGAERIMMRDCGFFGAEECRDEETIPGVATPGRLCHCEGQHCNAASANAGGGAAAGAALAATVLTGTAAAARRQLR